MIIRLSESRLNERNAMRLGGCGGAPDERVDCGEQVDPGASRLICQAFVSQLQADPARSAMAMPGTAVVPSWRWPDRSALGLARYAAYSKDMAPAGAVRDWRTCLLMLGELQKMVSEFKTDVAVERRSS